MCLCVHIYLDTVTYFFWLIRDSDCNRKLKNVSNHEAIFAFLSVSVCLTCVNIHQHPTVNVPQVLNTVFWLGKAASSCTSYSGPSLNLKEFEGLLAQMKVVSEFSEEEREREGHADSGVEEVRGIDLFVSCLCWNAGQTHICVLVLLPPLFTTAATGEAGCEGRKIGFADF